ncbi:MAG TPA: CHRD domain-containing protein [Candidatus Dormibacteraeota bacterium]|nr:CHRD domain-containing protein [Candidatus Dormibacteraeota bacterium]
MRTLVSALSGMFILAACGGSTTTTVTSAPSPTPAINFTMTTQNASGVSGTGQVVKTAGSFTVTIKLTGLAPSSSHISHIHMGACAAPGGVAYALQQVVADSSGAATVTSTVQVDYSVPATGWYVNVHHGPDFSAPANGPSVSCGDLPTA